VVEADGVGEVVAAHVVVAVGAEDLVDGEVVEVDHAGELITERLTRDVAISPVDKVGCHG
jgi:hypothetical protein